MTTGSWKTRLLACIMTISAATRASAQETVSSEAAAVRRLREYYFAMDYFGGAEEASRLVRQYPKSRPLAAWRVANFIRDSRTHDAESAASALLRANATDPWGWFAEAIVHEYSRDHGDGAFVLKSSLEAYERAPANPDVQWLRVMSLSAEQQPASAVALIDTIASNGVLPQPLVTLRATAVLQLANAKRPPIQTLVDSAMALYAVARRSDPQDATAYTFAASRMMNVGKNADAYPLARQGSELSPLSLVARETYWRAINGLREKTQADRDAMTLADVRAYVGRRGSNPEVLFSAATQYEERGKTDSVRALYDRILSSFPHSFWADWVYVSRYRQLGEQHRDTTNKDSTLTPRYRAALWSFVSQPVHSSDRLLGDAYRELFYLTDSTTNADTLLRVVRGMVTYEGINPHVVYADGAIRLAQRGRDYAAAERIAREGLMAGKKKIDGQRSGYETIGDYASAADWMSAHMYDAIGYIYFRQRRFAEAEKQLKHARDLDSRSARVLLHLGELAEARGDRAAAEELYIKGALIPGRGINASRAALERLFVKRTGSNAGLDAYLARIETVDRENRKSEIAKSRQLEPKALAPFSLTSLDGKIVTPDSLHGRVAVINAWGMWCGPCVAELPEYQRFATQMAGDTNVRVLTINNDPNTDVLRGWMAKKGYSFATLIDNDYLAPSNIRKFPTTLFVGRDGRVAFEKVGWSEKLTEEFSWRVEMLKSAP